MNNLFLNMITFKIPFYVSDLTEITYVINLI